MYNRLILLICAVLISATSFGQAPYFQKYSLLKKKEPVQVNAIFQDHSGFMWYGTNKGLFKYDGLSFVQYTQKDSLPDNNVTAIAEDSLGQIWTGHHNGSLSILSNTKFKRFEPPEGNSKEEISDILFDKHGNLWYATHNDGLYYFINNRLYRVDEENGLPDLFIYDLEEDKNGVIWIGTDGGVVSCNLTGSDVSLQTYSTETDLPDNIIKKLVLDDQHIWMATEDAGIISFDLKTQKIDKTISIDAQFGSLIDFVVMKNEVWIATSIGGISVKDLKTGSEKMFTMESLPVPGTITNLFNDVEGNVWIGTRIGVIRCHGDDVEFIENVGTTSDENILALTFDKNNSLWFSNNEGLFKRSVHNGKAGIVKQLNGTRFQKFTIVSLYCDPFGFIWAGLYGEGALRINPATNQITYLNKELRNGNVLNIAGKDNEVWLATLGGGTRITIHNEKLDIKNYSQTDGLISDYIYQVFVDSKNRVWFATDGKGVDMMDKDGFHHFEKDFTSKVVYGFAEDKLARIWANVQGDGLYRFESSHFELVTDLKIRDNTIASIGSGAAGNILVMHDLGIDIIDVTGNAVHYLTDETGVVTRKANLNATANDIYDRLYFGTDAGIISYSGGSSTQFILPTPFIDGLRVLNENRSAVQGLRLEHFENSITINYHGFWYQNPASLSYKYTLLNYDHEWISTVGRSVTYSSLPPGRYTFQVMVSDTDDFANSEVTSFQFVIEPPFWKTFPFYFFIAFLVLVFGYSFLRYRERRLITEKRILEEKVTERTQEIQRKTEEINAQAEEIRGINENLEMLVQERTRELEKKNKALEESAFIIAHELRAPVASILGLINLIAKTKLNEEGEVIVKHMNESAEKLNTIVRSITKAIERGDDKSIGPK